MVLSGVTFHFDCLPSWASEIEHSAIFSHPQENQLANNFSQNLICCCSLLFPNVESALCIYRGM